MHPNTYERLPRDVKTDLDNVLLSRAVRRGEVHVKSQGGVTSMPVNAFIRARRKVRKAERRNRKAGRR